MFRVEILPDSSTTATPGWTYVPDRRFNTAQAAMAPTLGRKRGIRDAGKGGDISSRQQTAIVRHLAELDRENQRDVQIPVPVKQTKEAGSRGTRAKTTSNVRRILQSQKTFRNHLDDEEAALAAGGGGGGGGGGGVTQSIGNVSAGAVQGSKAAASKGGKAATTTAMRRSATPALSSSSATTAVARRRKRASTAATTAPTTTTTNTPSASTTPAPPGHGEVRDTEPAASAAEEDDDSEHKNKLIKTEYDNDPLLRSYAPSAPSDRIMQRLLAEPPLSYNAARARPPLSGKPPRSFCCMCGYWGKIRCKSCHLRTCGLDCYKVHEDSRCGAFF